jgi:lipopolysaccharide heptosyltransferase I
LNILLIRLSAMGDVVRTLPALMCLRRAYPQAHITWAVEEASRDILADQADLDEVLVFPRRKLARLLLHPDEIGDARAALATFTRALKEARFDLVIDFQGTFKSGLMARLTGAPRRVGLGRGQAREMSYIFYTETAKLARPQSGKQSRVERALALVAHLGVSTEGATSSLPERAEDAAYVEEFLRTLASAGGPAAAPVVIFPGTSRVQAYKRYPPANFARAADQIGRQTGAPVVVAWGPGEQEIASEVVAAMATAAVLSPSLTLGQLTALIRRARVFVAGDTGPMHIAWTVDTPLVAVYGPTDPEVNQPGGRFSAIAYDKVFCSPCRNRGCIARTCLEHLDPDLVARAAHSVIQRADQAGRVAWSHGPSASVLRPSGDPPGTRFETMGPGMRPSSLDA